MRGCYWGLGVGSGILVSGFLVDWVDVVKTYFIYSFASVLVLVLFSFTHLFVRLRGGKRERDKSYKLVATSKDEVQK